MASNGFRLRTLQRLRESQRDALRARLAEALRAGEKLDEQRGEIERELAGLTDDRAATTAAPTMDVARLLNTQRYEAGLRTKLAALDRDRAKVGEEVARRREAAVAGERAVAVLEKLEQRHGEREAAEAKRRDAALMDEIASQREHRKRAATHG